MRNNERKHLWLATTVMGVVLLVAEPARTQPQRPLDDALNDLRAGRSLPELPDLKRPVFVAEQSIVCSTPGTLANPNKDVLVAIGECMFVEKRVRVNVVLPKTQQGYIEGHISRAVEIVWRSAAQSDGTIYSGWTEAGNLKN